MFSEKFNNNESNNFDKVESGLEAGLLPKEKEVKLKQEITESAVRLKDLVKEFDYLSEEDYFETREQLQSVLDMIKQVKIEQQLLSSKLEEVLKGKDELTAKNVQEQLDNDIASKN